MKRIRFYILFLLSAFVFISGIFKDSAIKVSQWDNNLSSKFDLYKQYEAIIDEKSDNETNEFAIIRRINVETGNDTLSWGRKTGGYMQEYPVDFRDNNFYLLAEGTDIFSVEINLTGAPNLSSAYGKIFVDGKQVEEDKITRTFDWWNICFPLGEEFKTYQVKICKGISLGNGESLKKDIEFSVKILPKTYVDAGLLLENGEEVPIWLGNNFKNEQMTATDKTFLFHFSRLMNKDSVEKAITENDKEAEFEFNWISDHTLQVDINNIKLHKTYNVDILGAATAEGYKLTGWVDTFYRFDACPKQEVVEWDIEKNTKKVLFSPSEWIYMPVLNQTVDKHLLLYTDRISYSISDLLGNIKVINENNMLGDLNNIAIKATYIGDGTYIVSSGKKIYQYKLPDVKLRDYPKLSAPNNEEYIIQVVPNEDCSYFALLNDNFSGEQYVSIVNSEGDELYKTEDIQIKYTTEYMCFADLCWINKTNCIVKGKDKAYMVDITTGEKSDLPYLIESPEYREGLLAGYETKDNKVTYFCVKEGKRIDMFTEEIKEEHSYVPYNITIIDGSRVLLSKNNKILSFDVNQEKSSSIDGGLIFGVSEDHSKVYYITNVVDQQILDSALDEY